MTLVVEDDEALDPVHIAALGAHRVVTDTNLPADPIEQAKLTRMRWMLRRNAAIVCGGGSRQTVA